MEFEQTAARLQPLAQQIRALLTLQNRVVVGLDGLCASGKTTAAAWLAQEFGAGVVHMDDFFLPLSLRTPERLAEPGGNVHYERFEQEVLPCLQSNAPFSYRRFNCAIKDYDDIRLVSGGSVVVVEGAYCLHPRFGNPYDLRVFSSIDPVLQQQRIRARNGDEGWPMFRDKWIPMEILYAETFNIQKSCNICLY